MVLMLVIRRTEVMLLQEALLTRRDAAQVGIEIHHAQPQHVLRAAAVGLQPLHGAIVAIGATRAGTTVTVAELAAVLRGSCDAVGVGGGRRSVSALLGQVLQLVLNFAQLSQARLKNKRNKREKLAPEKVNCTLLCRSYRFCFLHCFSLDERPLELVLELQTLVELLGDHLESRV